MFALQFCPMQNNYKCNKFCYYHHCWEHLLVGFSLGLVVVISNYSVRFSQANLYYTTTQ